MFNEFTRVGRFDARGRRGGRSSTGHDHSHMHEIAAGAQEPAPAPAAPQAPALGQPPAAPGGGGGRGGRNRRAVERCYSAWHGQSRHARLKESSRHGEWADIKMADGGVVKSWVVYPERAQKAGVVLVIHDIRGMSDMARALGDQLARTASSPSCPTSCRGRGRTAAGPNRSAATSARPSRGSHPPTSPAG